MDRNLALEAVRVTEAAALFASRYVGRGTEEKALSSAIDAMKMAFSSVSINGIIITGKGNNINSLSCGEAVGNKNGPEVDVVVSPLDGTTTCSSGGYNSISAIAIGECGSFLNAPKLYMEKIAVGEDVKGIVDITQPPEINIKRVARAKGKYIEDLTVCLLDRERHGKLIANIREVGARIVLIKDGDISGAIAPAMEDKPIDILMGIGGSMEGILSATAIKCIGGDIQARFVYQNDDDKKKVLQTGEKNLDRIYSINDLIQSNNVMFSATGITDGVLLPGVHILSGGAETNSISMRSKTHTLRFISAIHQFDYKPLY